MIPDHLAQLRVSLHAPDTARVGSVIPMVIRLENVGDARMELYLRGRTPAFDIFVRDAGGKVVWHRLEGEAVPGIVQFKILEPGRVLDLSHKWDQRGNRGEPVGPGLYTAHGMVLTDGPEPLESSLRQIVIAAR